MDVLSESLKVIDVPLLWETDRVSFRTLFCYRLVVLILGLLILFFDILRMNYFQLLIFLTTWGFLMTNLFFALCITDQCLTKFQKNYAESPLRVQLRTVTHILFQTVFAMEGS
eukprot:TRINITY_DN7414_c0_g2_i1.p1 TRINITY_DN7414_c0_g2~~TRINITY_DN7414_c0_g2_i1.p1  ORF type:complete len:113 (+),score=4.49 TRINITY_DN7414_c0_g2_i1:45-383(+)